MPNHIPGSIKHPIGFIQYYIKATIDIPRGFDKHTDKLFRVVTRLDLNLLSPSLRQPMQINESKKILFLFGGVIYASFRLHKSGFVPGEVVTFEAYINNTSSRDVIRNRIMLMQYLRLIGQKENITKIREEKREMARLVIDKRVRGNTSKEVKSSEPFILPQVCTTLDGLCRIIDVKYALIFTFGVRGSSNKELEIPITIGNVPLQNENEILEI